MKLKGLEPAEIPHLPSRKVTPRQVKAMVERIQAEILKLRPLFGISGEAAAARFVSGTVPSSVYGNLAKIGYMLEALGAPAVKPTDVFRVAVAVVRDLKLIAVNFQAICRVKNVAIDPSKEPKDVYEITYQLLEDLHAIALRVNVGSFAGLAMPRRFTGTIKPAHVFDLMNNVLADIGVIKIAFRSLGPSVVPPEPPAKVPPDVFAVISGARSMARCLAGSRLIY